MQHVRASICNNCNDWRPAVETDLAWALPEPGSACLFASGADGTVRALAAADGIWRTFSSGTAPQVRAPSRLDVACRTPRQIEVFTQTRTYQFPHLNLHFKSVLRENGILVRKRFKQCRWVGYRKFTWIGFEKRTGRGEGSSGIAFDQVIQKKPSE